MKKIILLIVLTMSFAFTTVKAIGKTDLVDIDTMTTDTVMIFQYIGSTTTDKVGTQLTFDGFDCIDSWYDYGYTNIKNDYPAFVEYQNATLPQVFDSTATRSAPNGSQLLFSRYPVDGVRKWTVFLNDTKFNAEYIVIVFYKGSCTSGVLGIAR